MAISPSAERAAATVLTTIDTDFEIGATIFRTGEAAIASGIRAHVS